MNQTQDPDLLNEIWGDFHNPLFADNFFIVNHAEMEITSPTSPNA